MDEGLRKQLCQKLADFDFTRCGMAHEKIQLNTEDNLPVLDSSVDHGFAREHYCDPAIRETRLGCAHTMARNNFENILNKLPESEFDADEVSRWKNEVQELDMAIIRTDWDKSDAELDHARILVELSEASEQSAAQQKLHENESQIRELIKTQNKYIARLEQLCATLKHRLESMSSQ